MPAQTVSDVTYSPDSELEILDSIGVVMYSAPLLADGIEQPVKRNTEPMQAEGNDAQGRAGAGEIRMGRWQYELIITGSMPTERALLLDALSVARQFRLGTDIIPLADGGNIENEVPINKDTTRVTISPIPSSHLQASGTKVGLK
jgi:hypothetical protein